MKGIQKRQGLQKGGKGVPGGILPKQVIPDHRKRANRKIRQCVAVSNRGSMAHFQANAGPNSEVERHHDHVQFLGYDSALSGGLAVPDAAKQMAKRHGQIRLRLWAPHVLVPLHGAGGTRLTPN